MAEDRTRCVRCDCLIDENNDSEEHVIPNSVGGRLKVRGFICMNCNTGKTWDKELAEQLNFFCLFFGVVRERGEAPPEPIETTAGERLLMQPGGGFMLQKPIYEEMTSESGKQIHITARTMREAAEMLKGVARKFPKVDPADEIKKASSSYSYPEGAVHHSPTFGGPLGGRSVVKTAVAFAHHAGVSSDRCDEALAYLRDEAATPCFGYFYESDLVVSGRPAQIPIHAIAVSANSETGLLLGYVEYFGIQRVVVCLSRSYRGPTFERSYGLNPLIGEAIPVRLTLPFSSGDIQAIYDYERIPDGSVARIVSDLMPSALARQFEREQARAIADAVQYAFANCGAKKGDLLTEEQKAKLPRLIIARMMPFILPPPENLWAI